MILESVIGLASCPLPMLFRAPTLGDDAWRQAAGKPYVAGQVLSAMSCALPDLMDWSGPGEE